MDTSGPIESAGPIPDRRRLKILEIETYGRGGLIHYAFNLSSALAQRGHEVTLLTTIGDELQGLAEPPAGLRVLRRIARFSQRHWGQEPGGVKTGERRAEARGAGSRDLGFFGRQLRRVEAIVDAVAVTILARRLQPDLIHLHCTHGIGLLYLRLLKLLGVPVVETAHVVLPHERGRFQTPIYGRIHRLADLVIAHSEADRRRLAEGLGVALSKVEVIPHGEYGFFERCGPSPSPTEARESLGLELRDKVVLFFGYIRKYKGLDILLEAWPRVAETFPDARLVIAGNPMRLDAEQRRALEHRATELGAIHRLEYIPFEDVARYFAAADVLAMPYRAISQSGVLYLALALGVPVVATRVGGLPEILTEGESALLIAPEALEELAEALGRMLGDPALRDRLAEGGRRIAAEHSWSAIAQRTEAAFTVLLDKG